MCCQQKGGPRYSNRPVCCGRVTDSEWISACGLTLHCLSCLDELCDTRRHMLRVNSQLLLLLRSGFLQHLNTHKRHKHLQYQFCLRENITTVYNYLQSFFKQLEKFTSHILVGPDRNVKHDGQARRSGQWVYAGRQSSSLSHQLIVMLQ